MGLSLKAFAAVLLDKALGLIEDADRRQDLINNPVPPYHPGSIDEYHIARLEGEARLASGHRATWRSGEKSPARGNREILTLSVTTFPPRFAIPSSVPLSPRSLIVSTAPSCKYRHNSSVPITNSGTAGAAPRIAPEEGQAIRFAEVALGSINRRSCSRSP